MLEAVSAPLVFFVGSVIFLGSGKFSVGCGKGATFPLEKQSACNYIRADCVQRKCVPRIRAGVTLRRLCMHTCVCVRVFASHLFYRQGKDVEEVEASSAHTLYRSRQARSCEIL